MFAFSRLHGWEIAVILRNFRKTKLSKSKFLSFSFFFFFFFYSISTCIQCATRRLSLCGIRKYRFPAFYGTSDRQAAIFFCTRMIQTWSSFSLVDPCSIFFCFSVKPKFFTPTHEAVCLLYFRLKRHWFFCLCDRFGACGAVFLLHGHHDQGAHLPTFRHPPHVPGHQVSAMVTLPVIALSWGPE